MKNKKLNLRITNEEVEQLQKLALALNYTYGGKPSISKLLKDIANEKIVLAKKIP